jgi:hypothetical protein
VVEPWREFLPIYDYGIKRLGRIFKPTYPLLNYRLIVLQRDYVLGTRCFAQSTLLCLKKKAGDLSPAFLVIMSLFLFFHPAKGLGTTGTA